MSAAVLRNLTLLLLGCLTLSRLQAADPDQLLVTGPNFAFSVTEPKGWKGDTANASKVEANIAFYRRRETLDSAAALITIRVFHKEDDETEKDLQADMKGYQEKFPNVQFRDIGLSNPRYLVFSKLFCVPDQFHEYVASLTVIPTAAK